MSKITPFVRCESNAAELASFYLSVFPESKLCEQNQIVTTIEVFGQTIGFINGGPHAKPNPSISLSLWILDKDLTKQIWDKLSDGGLVMMEFLEYPRSPAYGRCNDKFGVSRQVMYDNCEEHETHRCIPSLMFTGAINGRAKEAMNYYTSLFPNSKIESTWPYTGDEGETPGNLAHAEFLLDGQKFIIQESGLDHKFGFDDGVSLAISCDGQQEVDTYRDAFVSDGGQEVQCGRCKDKYGISRQVVPVQSQQAIFHAETPEKGNYAMQAMMKMKKIVIADLYEK